MSGESERNGIPYSINEARLAAEENEMDQYHKELILFLCDKVENLEDELEERKELD